MPGPRDRCVECFIRLPPSPPPSTIAFPQSPVPHLPPSYPRELLQSQGSYESSGQITFPDELRMPGPRDRCVECFIRRSRKTGTFTLFLGVPPNSTENGKFLLAARKCGWRPSSMEYVVSLDPKDFSRGGSSFVGRLRANFLSTRFAVFESSHEVSVANIPLCNKVSFRRFVRSFRSANTHRVSLLFLVIRSFATIRPPHHATPSPLPVPHFPRFPPRSQRFLLARRRYRTAEAAAAAARCIPAEAALVPPAVTTTVTTVALGVVTTIVVTIVAAAARAAAAPAPLSRVTVTWAALTVITVPAVAAPALAGVATGEGY
ncbi:unnamed protein product [Closterium sp. Yama58-4]|nr:unnamed protein product [Closterium sp. Yama58-4]